MLGAQLRESFVGHGTDAQDRGKVGFIDHERHTPQYMPRYIEPKILIGIAYRLTFVSDGVVEAENAHRELFGFERTRAISGKSAAEIADAAMAWGQNDDITVVTVRRNG